MKILKTIFLPVIAVLTILTSCKTTQKTANTNDMATLLEMMTGSFNSAEQAAADSSYFNISLHMYPIWADHDGRWIYVEQALNEMQEKPYRQRVYRLEQTGSEEFKTTVYTLTNQDEAAGKWKTPGWFDQFDESLLEERRGCGVYLKKTAPGKFQGSTKKGKCVSSLRGASYATSIVTITDGQIYSWDQGFNEQDKQVWGATEGGYVFKKIN